MKFIFPVRLWFLLALAPVLLFLVWCSYRRLKELLLLKGRDRKEHLVSRFLVREFLVQVFLLLGIAGLLVAYAEPFWGMEQETVKRRNADIVLLFDISRSMLVRDVPPSRLEVAKEIALMLVSRISGARWGVVAFKGKGELLLPLTPDLLGLEDAIGLLTPVLLRSPGTDVASGLSRALEAFPQQSNRQRLVILLSDGEALTGEIGPVLELARNLGVAVHTVGIGTESGGPVPLEGEDVLKKPSGEPVISRLDASLLKRIAEITGGRFFSVRDAEGQTFQHVVSTIEETIAREEREGIRLVPARRYPLFVGLSFLAFSLMLLVRGWRWEVEP
ncbi:vWA domain-containing protein [Spirochaeta thermophila]|uniref:von Willebrand factor type A n=1 Tax=Winmispira thermophila (strain ATCC 49972 / DSM 6192 / RI 19.B1) TaxID=665571 RepID=E0RNM4_WINT6|nr:VWA domain-containing protein [Spirochaeta thermophila]ADN02615.1 von Willebrand factor type A [Spirochaeta thermophila DSM 6192]